MGESSDDKLSYDPVLSRRSGLWSALDDIDDSKWLDDSQETNEFKSRVEIEIRERIHSDTSKATNAEVPSLPSGPSQAPSQALSQANDIASAIPTADARPKGISTPRPSAVDRLRSRQLVPNSTPDTSFAHLTSPSMVETPTAPQLRGPPRAPASAVALDTPVNVPTPTQTPQQAGDTTVGRGRRDDPATPVPLASGGPKNKNLQTLTKHFDQFSKTVAGPSTEASRGRGRGRGRGLGMRSSRAPSNLGLGGTVLKGLRFCIPPENNLVSKHKGRWEIVTKLGGQVVLQPDTAITHVIHDSGRSAALLARELGIQSLADLPEGTVCVKWDWVVQCKLAGKVLDVGPWLSFPQTTLNRAVSVGAASRTSIAEINADLIRSRSIRRKRNHTPSDSETESSEIPRRMSNAKRMVARMETSHQPIASSSTYRSSPALPTSSAHPSSEPDRIATRHDVPSGPGWIEVNNSMQDGLDEMIIGVKNGSIETKEVEEPGSDNGEHETGNPNRTADFYKCGQDHDGKTLKGPNEWLACKFDDLHDLYEGVQGKNDFAIRGYQKAAGILRRTSYEIKSGAQARKIKGIGSSIADRIDEFLSGAQGRAFYEDTEKARTIAMFKDIYGVGKNFANELYRRGARSIADLRTKDFKLTSGQKLGVELYEDLISRIPRDECKQIYEAIRESALAIDPKLWIEIMGSYRRGAESSGDVDILITRDTSDGITHVGVLKRLINDLHSRGIFTHDLSTPSDFSCLEAKWMGVGRLSPAHKYRRIDILCIPFEQWGAALIYFTGNEVFNRSLRLYARKKGYSLNQRGLSHGVMRDRATGLKTTEGEIIASRTEEEIFGVLGIRWRPPHQRRP